MDRQNSNNTKTTKTLITQPPQQKQQPNHHNKNNNNPTTNNKKTTTQPPQNTTTITQPPQQKQQQPNHKQQNNNNLTTTKHNNNNPTTQQQYYTAPPPQKKNPSTPAARSGAPLRSAPSLLHHYANYIHHSENLCFCLSLKPEIRYSSITSFCSTFFYCKGFARAFRPLALVKMFHTVGSILIRSFTPFPPSVPPVGKCSLLINYAHRLAGSGYAIY